MQMAHVIGTPLQERDRNRRNKCFSDSRNVPEKKLVLQIARSGRNDDLATPHQCRNQIGKGLARSRPRFGHQRLATDNRLCDGLRHLELHRPSVISVDHFGEGPIRTQKANEIFLIDLEVVGIDKMGR